MRGATGCRTILRDALLENTMGNNTKYKLKFVLPLLIYLFVYFSDLYLSDLPACIISCICGATRREKDSRGTRGTEQATCESS